MSNRKKKFDFVKFFIGIFSTSLRILQPLKVLQNFLNKCLGKGKLFYFMTGFMQEIFHF